MNIPSQKHLPPRRIASPTTQIDVSPAALGLLGPAYRAPVSGPDVMHTSAAGLFHERRYN
jgi:hypothetical protein